MTMRVLLVVFCCVAASGCACEQVKYQAPQVASVSQVIDAVKDELNAYQSDKPVIFPPGAICSAAGKSVGLVPKTITVTLEAVALHKSEPSGGLGGPIGVIKLDPSFSGSYSAENTQTLVIPLGIDNSKSSAVVKSGPHPIADAIHSFQEELVRVDHNKTPCLNLQSSVSMKLDFDVVNQSTGGVSLQLAVFKLGDKETFLNENHQKIELTFDVIDPSLLQSQ